ncbi:hypothetical protein R0J90_20930, partial [Micrococcus sp. SIMBA_144]
ISVAGTVVGALRTLVPAYRCTDELADRCGAALLAATGELAHLLGAADTPRERPAASPGTPKASSQAEAPSSKVRATTEKAP